MNKIIPDDINDQTFFVDTTVSVGPEQTMFTIDADFRSVDDVFYDIYIEHHEDTSIMILSENETAWKFYFSPYITQKYFKNIMPEYSKTKPNVNHKLEVITLINKIIKNHLSCEEMKNEK